MKSIEDSSRWNQVRSIEIFKEIAEILENVEERIERLKLLDPKDKEKAAKKIKEARKNFLELSNESTVENEELANFFLKRAMILKTSTTDKNIEKIGKKSYMRSVDEILKFSRVAMYEFTDRIKEVLKGYRIYALGMMFFFMLCGVLPASFKVVTLFLLVPVLFSLWTLKKRRYLALMSVFILIPLPIIIGILAIGNGVHAITNPAMLQEIAESMAKSLTFIKALFILTIALGALEVALLSYAAYMLYKHRHAFL